jgi:hypothetical protein
MAALNNRFESVDLRSLNRKTWTAKQRPGPTNRFLQLCSGQAGWFRWQRSTRDCWPWAAVRAKPEEEQHPAD